MVSGKAGPSPITSQAQRRLDPGVVPGTLVQGCDEPDLPPRDPFELAGVNLNLGASADAQ
jgi:hypothetical protein